MSSAADAFGQIVAQYQDKLSTVGPKSVLSQLALMGAFSLGTILAFNVLRPKNKIVYEPKVKYYVGDKQPPKISDGFFSWLSPLMHTKEPELLDKVGLDAVTFLRFLRMLRWLFLGVSLLSCGVLIPINVVYNIQNVDKDTRNSLSILTIQDVKGTILFAHVAVTYIINMAVLFAIWWHWKAMISLRQTWFHSPEYVKSFYARTLMVTKVPKTMQSDEGLRRLFDELKMPYPTTAVHIGRRAGKLPELVEYHNDAVRDLEQVLVKYLHGGKIGKTRPTIRLNASLGCCGGETRDAIEYYTNKLKKTEGAIEDGRGKIDTNKPEPYGFASLAAVPYAHIVAKILHKKHPKGTTIELAPNPKDIIWKNLTQSDAVRARNELIGWSLLALVIFFYTFPLLLVSLFANLASVAEWVQPLQTWSDASPWSFSLVSGVLPPAISAFFNYFLPKIMRRLSKYQGATTRSRLDRAVVARYFGFLIFSQFLVFTLIGVVYKSVTLIVLQIGKHQSFITILKSFNKLPGQIQVTYIEQSSYWLTFFPLQGFLAVFDLAQLINVVWIFFKTRIFGRTPRDIREWTQPPDFQYSIYYSNMLFMVAVGIVYAPLAPLVPLAAAVVFWISSLVYKYQLMFVFVSKVESGGRLWNVVTNRLLSTIIFMNLLMILTIGLVHGWKSWTWISLMPPVPLIFLFKIWIVRSCEAQFRFYIPSPQEIAQTKVHSDSGAEGKLEKRFGHPALHADLFTPMVHAKMLHLLPQVYTGKLSNQKTALDEYGGQKLNAAVTSDGVRIAAVEQADLDYDPALYQRDRGEQDWDARSIASMSVFGDPRTSQLPAPAQQRPSGYDRYMMHGATQSTDEIELMTRTTSDAVPLLSYQQPAAGVSRFDNSSRANLRRMDSSESGWSSQAGAPSYHSQPPPPVPNVSNQYAYDPRAAPTHRPYAPYQAPPAQYQAPPAQYQAPPPHSRQTTQASMGPNQNQNQNQNQNMAGRGTYNPNAQYGSHF